MRIPGRVIARRLLLVALFAAPGLVRAAAAQNDTLATATARRAVQAHPLPGDHLAFRLYQQPDQPAISWDATVDERGFVTLPKIGTLNIGAIPIARIRDTLAVLATEVLDLNSVVVDATVLRRVVMSGAVAKPGIYYVDPETRVRDVVVLGGGMTEFATGDISISRNGRVIPVPNWQFDMTDRSELFSGDEIVAGRQSWLQLNIISVASLALAAATLLISLFHR